MIRKSIRNMVTLLATCLLLVLAALPAQGIYRLDDGSAPSAGGIDYAYVVFADAPLASYDGSVAGYAATKPGKGHKLDLNSPAAKKYSERLAKQRNQYTKWLMQNHPQVEIVAEYAVTANAMAIKLNGVLPEDLRQCPGAVAADYSDDYTPAMNASHDLINDAAVWSALGGRDGAGAGIKVGVIDTGIDQSHPFLRDAGYTAPAGFPKGDLRYTSNKVIVAKVFSQNPWLDARAAQDHGTHVSGTIAGRAGTTVYRGDGSVLADGLSGVAPGAYLGSYNVFPGDQVSAKSLFIAKAVEEAVIDGMDVLNLSLGGGAHKGKDILEMAVDGAADAGVVVAVAAGNEGPGYYTVGSPGTAEGVITVAAITNQRTFAMTLEAAAFTEPAMATTGTGNGELKNDITGLYDVWADHAGGDGLACAPIDGTPFAGKIALIQRGTCTFSTKINNAAAAGAMAVVIYNNSTAAPIPMATDGVTIPAMMISRSEGEALKGWTDDRTVTMRSGLKEMPVPANLLADFSSWGPTPNYTLKPDVAAPGVDILSSVPGGGYAVFQGTSMATPHVAGSAALLLAYSRANNLGWGPAEVKAALMGTAHDASANADPLKIGAGIVDLKRAMNPPAMALPSSLSFELVRPVGNHTYAITFTLTNTSAATQTYTLSEASGALSLNPASVMLAKGESASITATVVYRGLHWEPAQGPTPLGIRGYVVASSGAGDIRIPYLYVIDYNR